MGFWKSIQGATGAAFLVLGMNPRLFGETSVSVRREGTQFRLIFHYLNLDLPLQTSVRLQTKFYCVRPPEPAIRVIEAGKFTFAHSVQAEVLIEEQLLAQCPFAVKFHWELVRPDGKVLIDKGGNPGEQGGFLASLIFPNSQEVPSLPLILSAPPREWIDGASVLARKWEEGSVSHVNGLFVVRYRKRGVPSRAEVSLVYGFQRDQGSLHSHPESWKEAGLAPMARIGSHAWQGAIIHPLVGEGGFLYTQLQFFLKITLASGEILFDRGREGKPYYTCDLDWAPPSLHEEHREQLRFSPLKLSR